MGENRIKLGMSTDYLPIIDVGLYGTFLGDLWIKDEYIQDYKRLICEKAKEYMKNIFDGFCKIIFSNVTFCSPMYYNYRNDWLEFEIELDDVVLEMCEGVLEDEDFFEFAKRNFGSHSGFISFMPYTKEKYKTALCSNDARELAKVVGMYMTYLANAYFYFEEVQEDFENDIIEYVHSNTDWEVMEDDE